MPGPKVVKVLKFSKSGNHRPQVKKVRVVGNMRLAAGGTLKRARRRARSIKKSAQQLACRRSTRRGARPARQPPRQRRDGEDLDDEEGARDAVQRRRTTGGPVAARAAASIGSIA